MIEEIKQILKWYGRDGWPGLVFFAIIVVGIAVITVSFLYGIASRYFG